MISTLNHNTAFKIIYIQFILQINSQWTDIWFDDMESNNRWVKSTYTYFNYENPGCFTGNCVIQWAGDNTDAWMYTSTNIYSYSQVRLRYDLATFEMDPGDTCKIYYAYDSKLTKTLIKTIDPPSDIYNRYNDQYVTFPSAQDKRTIWIWLEADGDASGEDDCFWDNLYLQGVIDNAIHPTMNPNASTSLLYETIWYDDMERNNGWTITNSSDVSFSYLSDGCSDNLCTRTSTVSGMDRSTNISSYTDIMLQFDVSNYDMEPGDLCEVYYAYDSRSNKVRIGDYTGLDGDQRQFYQNQVLYLPSSPQSIIVWIFLEISGDSNEFCYWDNVYLKGISGKTTSSYAPSKYPITSEPSELPSAMPSLNVLLSTQNTASVTSEPSEFPSAIPSRDVSLNTASEEPSGTPSEHSMTSEPSGLVLNTIVTDIIYTVTDTTTEPTNVPTEHTKSPTERPLIKVNSATQSPTEQPTKHTVSISTTVWIESEVDIRRKASYTTKFIVYMAISILCCCVICVVVGLVYKYKLYKSEKDVKELSVSVIDANPVIQMQRNRVYSESQYAENEDEEKEHGISVIAQKGDVDHKNSIDDNIADIIPGYSAPQLGDAVDFKDLRGRVRGMTGGGIDEKMVERKEKKRELLKEWLVLKVKLPDYYDVLVENGYESLDIIKEITDEQELKDIGIVLKGHILKIMREIRRLNSFNEFTE